MSKKFKIMLASITLLLVSSILLGTSYSLWRTSYVQVGTNEVNIGCFTVTFTNLASYGGTEAGDINLTNSYPITETAGSALTPYVFKIKNECTIASNYAVNLETLNTSTFNTDYLRIKFNEASNNSGTSSIYTSLENSTAVLTGQVSAAKALTSGYLAAGGEVTYALRAWIDIDATTTTPNVMGATWNGKVTVTSVATETISPYTIVSGDLNTIGSEVKIADEEFYVIGQEDSTHVKLLSKWNLNVGSNAKGTATNLQDEEVRGDVSSSTPGYNDGNYYGTVAFSSTNYWYSSGLKPAYGSSYPAYVYDSNSTLYQYVNNYVTYLNTQGVNVSGRLIKQEELVTLGCNASTSYCDLNGTHSGTAPSWVYQTTYWSGSVEDDDRVWYVNSYGDFDSHNYSSDLYYGVRPVIILEK